MSSHPLKDLTVQYLESLLRQGKTHIDVTAAANDILREWYIATKRGKMPQPAASPSSTQSADVQVLPTDGDSTLSELQQAIQEAMDEADNQEPNLNELPPLPENFQFHLEGETKEEQLETLHQTTQNWHYIKELGTLRDTMVFSSGNIHADIMFVTDAPGLPEESHRKPFCGPAGQKFDAILKAMGLSRQDTYITHLVKYRPALPNQTTNNRPPTEEEIKVFRHVLRAEIELISPKVIVTLGAIATKGVLQSGDTPLSDLRGQVHRVGSIPVVASFNPSYLLRTEDIGERRKIWEDMLLAMELAEMSVSEKQKNYFLPKA